MRALLLALVAVLPVAAGAPITGDVVGSSLVARGDLDASSREGVLDLARVLASGRPVEVEWSEAAGWRVEKSWTALATPAGTLTLGERFENRSLSFGRGQLTLASCADDCRAFLLAERDARLSLRGDADGAIVLLREPEAHHIGPRQRGFPYAFAHEADAGWVTTAGLALSPARAEAEGALVLALFGAEGELRHAGGATPVRTGTERVPIAGPAERWTQSFLVLRLSDARVAAADGVGARLLAPALDVHTSNGSFVVPAAQGALDAGPRRALARDEDVRLDAPASVRVTAERGGPLGPRMVVTVAGTGAAVVAGMVLAPAPAPAAWWAALALALAAAGAAAAFYLRIMPAGVLENPNRRRVYDALREGRGEPVAALARRLGLSEGVARYHIRMLVACGLARAAPGGRFVATGVQDAARVLARAALRSGARGRIARLLAEAPAGATQRDLVERTGMSQRLVSYHLARLRETGLIAPEGERPARYVATEALRDVLG